MNPDPASIDRLHDLAVPPPVSWWPLTPGWWIVAGVLILAALAWFVRRFIRWQADRYRREALAILEHGHPDAAELAALVKRVALTAWPRDAVADLTGRRWLEFLDRTGGTNAFTQGAGAGLEGPVFAPAPESGDPELRRVVREWIRGHREPEDEPC